MSSFTNVTAVSTLAFLTACASPGGLNSPSGRPAAASAHTSHHPDAPAAAAAPGMPNRMQAMREMHDKMMNAKTPAERDALMAEHMKSMQGGMDMMKGMGCMGPMSGAAGMGGGMGGPMPGGMSGGDTAQRQQAMQDCTQMMQMMMDMMGQRMPNPPASK